MFKIRCNFVERNQHKLALLDSWVWNNQVLGFNKQVIEIQNINVHFARIVFSNLTFADKVGFNFGYFLQKFIWRKFSFNN